MAEKDDSFGDIFIPRLLSNDITENKIEILLQLMFINKVTKISCQYFLEHLKNPSLFKMMMQKFLQVYKNVKDSIVKCNLVKTLVEEYDFIDAIENTLQNNSVGDDENLLFAVRNVFATLSQQFSTEQIQKILSKNRCSMWNFKVLTLYSGLIYGINQSDLQISYITDLVDCLINSALSDCTLERFFGNITIYILLNKIKNIEMIMSNLSKLDCDSKEDILLLRNVECSTWVSKSLLLRGDKNFESWLQKCAHPAYMLEIYRILCSENPIHNGNTRILHKQKLFIASEKLLNVDNLKADTRLFIHNLMITYVPPTVLHMNNDKLTTILAESIRSKDLQLQWISLYNIKNILELSPDQNGLCQSLYENVDKILPKILHLLSASDHQENQKMILFIINHYGTSKKYLIKLLQYKQEVLICLKRCLSNQSRILRFLVQKSIENWKTIDNE